MRSKNEEAYARCIKRLISTWELSTDDFSCRYSSKISAWRALQDKWHFLSGARSVRKCWLTSTYISKRLIFWLLQLLNKTNRCATNWILQRNIHELNLNFDDGKSLFWVEWTNVRIYVSSLKKLSSTRDWNFGFRSIEGDEYAKTVDVFIMQIEQYGMETIVFN
jgi:hypothetical protein